MIFFSQTIKTFLHDFSCQLNICLPEDWTHGNNHFRELKSMARRELRPQCRLKMTAFIVSETYLKLFLVVDGLLLCALPHFVYLLLRIMGDRFK